MTSDEVIAMWQSGSKRAFTATKHLIESGDFEFALFSCHLATEKAIKATYIQTKNDTPPKSHNLVQLADCVGLQLTNEEIINLRELSTFSEFGRYGDETWVVAEATKENSAHWLQFAESFCSKYCV